MGSRVLMSHLGAAGRGGPRPPVAPEALDLVLKVWFCSGRVQLGLRPDEEQMSRLSFTWLDRKSFKQSVGHLDIYSLQTEPYSSSGSMVIGLSAVQWFWGSPLREHCPLRWHPKEHWDVFTTSSSSNGQVLHQLLSQSLWKVRQVYLTRTKTRTWEVVFDPLTSSLMIVQFYSEFIQKWF